MTTMKAVVFKGKDRIAIEEVPMPRPHAGEAVIKITTTTICGTDVHIVRGEYPVKPGLILGHEPVGVIAELGAGLEDCYASASASSLAPSRPAASVSIASMDRIRSAAARWVDGGLAIPSTARGPSICSFQTHAPTWR